MDVEILMTDKTVKVYSNIEIIFSVSTKHKKNDILYLKTYNDTVDKPSISIFFDEIICFKINNPVCGFDIKL